MRKRTFISSAALALLCILTASCAPVQRFRPAPLAPAAIAAQLESRNLSDPGLGSFIEHAAGRPIAWPLQTWNLRMLTLAAFYFSPALAVARAQVEIAQAGIKTAKMRPNPVLEFSPGVPNPYLLGLSLTFPIVTGGKRNYQIALAKNMSRAAQLSLAQTAWKVRGSVRAALLDYLAASHSLHLATAEQQLWATRVVRLSQQLTAGEISRPQVDRAQIALLNARTAESAARGRILEAKAALAAAIGIPVSGFQNVSFTWPDLGRLPSVATLPARQIQRDAVLNRLDVRQALAQYRAAQTALRLQIARQHPNFQLGPGYQYEETDNFFAPLFSIPLPLFNRNQGPIAEAEKRRQEAAASLLAVQASVIAQSEQALARYRAAYAGMETAAAALENLRHVRVPMARRAVSAGEMDWLSLNSVLLERSAAAEAALNSVFQAQTALGQLEDAVQKPLEPAGTIPLVLRAPAK